ncbi:putative transcriptional regulator [Rhodococcus sp. RD6.2]|jgi:DNA-binding transcriptional ArsR family regulator|uniref:ArsR/SmtB family transcription factor n=1 Tax=Rhodococcus sp. RD6.2 TaxID=260936 RepID=UPI00063BB971|nr:metalloregulator ArsR/SmtB family transcription factor [Rhodococcus sp. RD6.2]CRK49734.1 putative transcriptional regulator [Rhodococcus sp. RD6.2]
MVQYQPLDTTFAALADPTRRGILEHLDRSDATITELADVFDMTLTGIAKHVHLLERAGLVVTEKRGRVRYCRLGGNTLDLEAAWMARHRRVVAERLDHLGAFLDREPNHEEES